MKYREVDRCRENKKEAQSTSMLLVTAEDGNATTPGSAGDGGGAVMA